VLGDAEHCSATIPSDPSTQRRFRSDYNPCAEQGLTMEDARQVLITLAPLVGTARIVSASSKISRALGFALAVSELADEEDDADSM
jgi:hypothetical protein